MIVSSWLYHIANLVCVFTDTKVVTGCKEKFTKDFMLMRDQFNQVKQIIKKFIYKLFVYFFEIFNYRVSVKYQPLIGRIRMYKSVFYS